MTILTQAQTIRDETALGANTATRVGNCLVDIANDLTAKGVSIAAAEGDIAALESDVSAAQGDISTLQSDVSALQAAKAVGQIFMVDNSTPTVVGNTTRFFKIAGDTTDNNTLNNDFSTPVFNRLTYTGTTTKTFKVDATCAVSCDHGSHIIETGFYNSSLAAVDPDTVGRVMIHAGANKPTQVCCSAVFSLATDDYIEVHLRGVESAESYVVSNLNLIITEL